MDNHIDSEKKEPSFPAGAAMPSRRASRHVERIRIERLPIEKKDLKEALPPELEEEIDDIPEIIFEDYSEKAPEEKKPEKKPIRMIIAAVVAALIIIGVVVGIILCLKREKKGYDRNYMDQLRNQEIAVTEDESINSFFRSYYDAMSAGDTTILEDMYDDPSKANVSAAISTIVENYENLQVYTTKGLEDNELAVFVSNDVKFHNINTTAPSVDCFYLTEGPEEGTYKICADMYQNTDIIRFLRIASYLQPIRVLMADSDARLESALNSDKDLKNLYIVMQSMTDAVLDESAEGNGE